MLRELNLNEMMMVSGGDGCDFNGEHYEDCNDAFAAADAYSDEIRQGGFGGAAALAIP